jgi:glycosyltransferase involved in cell wall biosynthesis
LKVLILYDHSGPKYHRLLAPCVLMPDIELSVARSLTEQNLSECDILFINRAIGRVAQGTVEETMNDLKRTYNFKLIVDFDDHWELGPDHLLYKDYLSDGKTDTMIGYLRAADAVTVTHERLANEVKEFNSNVHILPNSIPDWTQFKVSKQPDKLTRLFWAGSITHDKDLELLRRPLQLIKRDKVRFVMGGYKATKEWDRMAKVFTTDSAYNTEVLEALPVEQYYAMYSKCDIALIPLLDTKFNSHKSNLKMLEAAHIGAPVIVSRVHPYLDFPEDLVNYVDVNNTWFSQIRRLLNDRDFAIDQGKRLKEYCSAVYNFDQINSKRKKLFDETIKQGEPGEVQESERNEVGIIGGQP